MLKRRLSFLLICLALAACTDFSFKDEDGSAELTETAAQVDAETDSAAAEAKAQAEAEKAKLAAEAKAKEDARLAAEAKAQAEAEKAKLAAETKAKEDARLAAEAKVQAEAEKARLAAEAKAKEEAQLAAQAKAQAEAEAAQRQAAADARARLTAKREQQTTGLSYPKVPRDKAAEMLGTDRFTPMGAEVAGNADGSIPRWTGSMRGVPAGLKYAGSGDVYPDPYKNEKPLFTITSANYQNYAERLSEGEKKMFEKYPDTFIMHVYPSHRDGRYNELVESRTKWNASHTKLVNGVDGLRNYTGAVPFPFPLNGAEALWNARVVHPHPTIVGVMDDIAVYLNGNTQQRRQRFVAEFPISYTDRPVGKVDEEAFGINAGLVHVTLEKPERHKGQMTIVHEALDQVTHERKAWVYIPGSRRVRRAPTVGYDTPDGPGGLVTVDDSLGFNGAMNRFDWELKGKKEVYIPYHSYKFDSPNVTYDVLLQRGHANPEYMRYELHRVWVVEASLKREARHVYAKRRFYIDEDSWQIVLLESYDGRGDLWRMAILNTIYAYDVKGFIARAQMFHDLQSGGYIAMRLVNETSPVNHLAEPQGEDYYSPANLRKMGR